jgi:hypothetical protein
LSLPRKISLAVLALSATAWATLLIMLGLWMLLDCPRSTPLGQARCILAGVAAIAGGTVLFMIVVADRLFPSVVRRMSMWRVERGTILVFLLSGGLAGLLLLFGGA